MVFISVVYGSLLGSDLDLYVMIKPGNIVLSTTDFTCDKSNAKKKEKKKYLHQ